MIPHQSGGMGLLDQILREESEADYRAIYQASGQATVKACTDRLMGAWTQKLIQCVTDEERLFVQALVYSTQELQKAIMGELSQKFDKYLEEQNRIGG